MSATQEVMFCQRKHINMDLSHLSTRRLANLYRVGNDLIEMSQCSLRVIRQQPLCVARPRYARISGVSINSSGAHLYCLLSDNHSYVMRPMTSRLAHFPVDCRKSLPKLQLCRQFLRSLTFSQSDLIGANVQVDYFGYSLVGQQLL